MTFFFCSNNLSKSITIVSNLLHTHTHIHTYINHGGINFVGKCFFKSKFVIVKQVNLDFNIHKKERLSIFFFYNIYGDNSFEQKRNY